MATSTKTIKENQLPVELLSKTLRSSSLKQPAMPADTHSPPPSYEEFVQDWPASNTHIQSMLTSIQTQVQILQNKVNEDIKERVVRCITLKNIPTTVLVQGVSTPTTYQHLVPLLKIEGGYIQELRWVAGQNSAEVIYLTEAASKKFVEKDGAGIVWPYDTTKQMINVKAIKSKPNELPANEEAISSGYTRCISAKVPNTHVLASLGSEKLCLMAKDGIDTVTGLNRPFGSLQHGHDRRRMVKAFVWHLYTIQHARDFMAELKHKFPDAEVTFFNDPCNLPVQSVST